MTTNFGTHFLPNYLWKRGKKEEKIEKAAYMPEGGIKLPTDEDP